MEKRIIKFRGKRVDNGEWIYGNVFIPEKLLAQVHICESTTYFDFSCGEEFETEKEYREIIKKGTSIGRFIPVEKESAGQFTGLLDKNGKEIYEGDIIKDSEGELMKIDWDEKFASFVIDKKGWAFRHYFGEAINPQNCEIIGNIYSNPELLTNK